MNTAFDVLQVSHQASNEEIKAAYLAAIQKYPPEQYPKRFADIVKAYERIGTEPSRLSYLYFENPILGMPELLAKMMEPQEEVANLPDAQLLRSLLKEDLNGQSRK